MTERQMTKGDKPVAIGISKAPEDPVEKKKWVSDMARMQISMWLGDKCFCLYCKHKYKSVEDFYEKSPHQGHTKDMSFVCKSCYPKYKTALKEKSQND